MVVAGSWYSSLLRGKSLRWTIFGPSGAVLFILVEEEFEFWFWFFSLVEHFLLGFL